jgi:RNA polymerase sigma-70 factor, ECF subfamily
VIALRGVHGPEVQAVPDSFDEFYAAYVGALTLQLYAYTGDFGDAQDLVQEAFCRAYATWEKVMGFDDPLAWVRRVAWNLARSRWRRHRVAAAFLRRQREQHFEGPSPDRVTLVAALSTIPADHRRAFVLYYLADMSVSDIAVQEGVATGTVKSWLHRARTALAARLTDDRPHEHRAGDNRPLEHQARDDRASEHQERSDRHV